MDTIHARTTSSGIFRSMASLDGQRTLSDRPLTDHEPLIAEQAKQTNSQRERMNELAEELAACLKFARALRPEIRS